MINWWPENKVPSLIADVASLITISIRPLDFGTNLNVCLNFDISLNETCTILYGIVLCCTKCTLTELLGVFVEGGELTVARDTNSVHEHQKTEICQNGQIAYHLSIIRISGSI